MFRELAWISSFREGESNRYRCPFRCSTATGEAGSEAASLVMRDAHQRVFTQWLGSRLEEQYRHLAEFVADHGTKLPLLRDLVPGSTCTAEHLLFLSDLKVLCGLLEAEGFLANSE
jgi:hypothetical protein